MRTFQYSDAKSHKFWNIEVSGKSFTVTFGKVGTAGQTQSKTFASDKLAQAEAEKLIREKLKKGYAETTPRAASSVAEALERAFAADPYDLASASAYADYLCEQGDPRGEFMQVQIALEDEARSASERAALKKKEASLLKKHAKEWLGPLAEVLLDAEPISTRLGYRNFKGAPVSHRFARGWLSRLEFHRLSVALARALAQAPQARFLRELVVEVIADEAPVGQTQEYVDSYYEPGPDVPANITGYDPGLQALCRCPQLATLRSFWLGEGEDGTHTSGRLAYDLVKQMPHLEELYLFAHRVDANKIFALPMPRLRVLQLYHSDSYPLDKLAANKSLTRLTTLLCQPHAPDFDVSGAYIKRRHLRAICRSPHLIALSTLQLRLTDFGDAGAKEIVESGILKRLKVLDLHGGCVTDEGAELLASCPDLKHLEHLDLSSNALTKAGVRAIKSTGVKATLGSQHGEVPEDDEDWDALQYLFEGDIE